MTTALTNFTSETQLTLAAVDMVSTNASEKKFIGKATFTNTSASNVEVTVWRLLTASTETTGSGGNWIVRKTIPAGVSWECYEIMGQVLGNSMSLSALASVTAVINVDISGTTEV